MTAQELMNIAPIDWEETINFMPPIEQESICRELEEIAKRAAMLAGYLDERHGFGCGDQGHRKATKRANRNGKMVWVSTFGYNAFHELTL